MTTATMRPPDLGRIEDLLPLLARGWRAARDQHACTQQRLHRLLAPRGGGMLAPVFDSLMTLCEAALGRRFAVGVAGTLSADETLLLGMLDGSRRARACLDCAEGAVRALDCSLCSTRIMLALAR
jgi:hypothetical protein